LIGGFCATGTPFLHTFADDLPGRVQEKCGNGETHNDVRPESVGDRDQPCGNDHAAVSEKIIPGAQPGGAHIEIVCPVAVEQRETNAVCQQGKNANRAHLVSSREFLNQHLPYGVGNNNEPE
jgi:hypothetical protein